MTDKVRYLTVSLNVTFVFRRSKGDIEPDYKLLALHQEVECRCRSSKIYDRYNLRKVKIERLNGKIESTRTFRVSPWQSDKTNF